MTHQKRAHPKKVKHLINVLHKNYRNCFNRRLACAFHVLSTEAGAFHFFTGGTRQLAHAPSARGSSAPSRVN
jgi:hypothetical protein